MWVFAVSAAATKLEETQPEAFGELYKEYSMKLVEVQGGSMHMMHDKDRIVFDPSMDRKGLTWGAGSAWLSTSDANSHAATVVHQEDFAAIWKYPFVRELPQAFFDLMAADLDGPLAEDYRVYIRNEVKPVLDRIKNILHEHYAAIEAPPQRWLIDTFPGHSKAGDTPTNIVDSCVSLGRLSLSLEICSCSCRVLTSVLLGFPFLC